MAKMIIAIFILLIGCIGCENMNAKVPNPCENRIQIRGLNVDNPIKRSQDMHEGQELSGLVLYMRSSWMNGEVELRFPEVLQSSMGFHFLDNYSSRIKPLHELDVFPQWKTDPQTSAIYYDCKLPEGLSFGAKAVPGFDEVELEFYVTNDTGQTLDFVEVNPCFNFRTCPDFNDSWNLENLFAYYDGHFQTMHNTTPTEQQIGRKPWLLFIMKSAENELDLPKDSGTWWMVDQRADENLLAAQSKDANYLVGYAWKERPKYMMSNCGYPCLHSGPGFAYDLAEGQTYTWKGKVYFLKNNKDALLRRYKCDRILWDTQLDEKSDGK